MARFLGVGQDQEEFFDSREVLSPASVSSPASSGRHDDGWLFDESLLEVWVRDPCSVQERRHRFVKSLGLLDPSSHAAQAEEQPCSRPESTEEILPASPSAELFSAAPTFASRGGASSDDGAGTEEVELECVFKNLDDGTVFVVDEMGNDGSFRSLRERRSNTTVTAAEFEQTYGSSPFIRELMRRVDDSDEPSTPEKIVMRRKRRRLGWLRRLGIGACVVDAEEDDEINSTSSSSYRGSSRKVDRVKVRPYKKRSKELSAVYKGQVIKAHEGAIVTMKFSSDGQYLATGGEDGVVRVWRVVEGEKPDDLDFVDDDPSCVFFTASENSELAPINSCEGGKGKHSKSSKGAADPACVVIPHRTFALSEDPVHEFYGHDDVILDLSWSKNRELLSASMDKTVRLWKVGYNSCLKVFSHNNYVTCIQFKPTNDDYFISGCIDGMVRIWDVPRCRVVDWADSKEIVTAVCYRPDGKGAVVGTLTGNCRYYDASENHLELESQVPLYGRKKSPVKRIIGFQYCPSDPKKLMVTSGDSQVRILDGIHVVSNYKGLRSSSQVAASFTPDGDHIISASDDSSIYMWNYANQIAPITSRLKTIWSYERFFCNDVSVAIPWNASPAKSSISLACNIPSSRQEVSDECRHLQDSTSYCHAEDSLEGDNLYQLPSGNFTLSSAFFAESVPRRTATWPEEELPSNSVTPSSTLRKSQYKFLKTSCQSASTHAWGQVLVTAVDVPEMAVEKSIAKLLCLQKLGWLKLTLVQITITVQRVTWLGACESEEGETLRPVFYGTFDYDTRQYDLEGLFSKYGPISRIDIKSGYAFIYFEDERDAEDAIRRLDNVSFGSRRRLSVEWSRQVEPVSRSRDTMPTGDVKRTRTLFVINFDPIRSKVKDIERHFEPYGKIAIYKHSCLKELYFCTV